MSNGDRDNKGKPKLSMVDDAYHAIEGLAKVLMHGEQKYSRGNWLKGLPWTEIYDSLRRHSIAFNAGKDIDDGPDGSGLPHVHFILSNAIFLAEMYETRKDLDDRTATQGEKDDQPIPAPYNHSGHCALKFIEPHELKFDQEVWFSDEILSDSVGPYRVTDAQMEWFKGKNDTTFRARPGTSYLVEA